MAVRIQFRRGTAAEWASANPTLAAGELGYETDTAAFKIGDGSSDWDTLAYGAVSQQYVADAIADVVGLSPESLDTLEELAAAMGDDPDFLTNLENTITTAYTTLISNEISQHNLETTNVHGIADTSLLETQGGAQDKANAAIAAASAYADSAIANLVDSSPSTLDTLNELAAALGDDPNFATTVSTALGVRITFETDSAANFTSADATLDASVFGIESDTGKFKIGDGITSWTLLPYAAVTPLELEAGVLEATTYTDDSINTHNALTEYVHGITNTADLVYSSQIANMATTLYVDGEVLAHNQDTLNVHGIGNTAELVTSSEASTLISVAVSTHNGLTNVHGISNTANLVYVSDIADMATTSYVDGEVLTHNQTTLNVHGIANTAELATTSYVDGEVLTHNQDTLNVHGIANTAELVTSSEASGLIDASIVAHNQETTNVHGIADTSALATSSDVATAVDGLAPLDGPTFTGIVTLPSSTSIGNVSSDEIETLDGVTSAIQTQLDGKLASTVAASTYAPLADATLTGTVSLPSTTSIGDVSATEIGYLNNVSSAIQTQLDDKLASSTAASTYAPIDSPTFTTAATLPAQTDIGTVTATEISYLANVSSSIQDQLDAKASLSGATFSGSVVVTGDLTVSGNTVTVGTQDLVVNDPMIYIGDDNQTNAVDLGLVGSFNDGTYQHTGLVRDAATDKWRLFSGVVAEPTTVIDWANATPDTLEVGTLEPTVGITFADGTTQTSAGVVSITGFTEKTASYTLDTLDHQDNVVEMNSSSATTFTIPTNATLAWPVGASMDIIQTGTGQVTIANAVGVTLNYTPGNKLRTQWSSCTIMKRAADSWILYGDLTA